MSQVLGSPPRKIKTRSRAGMFGLIFARLFILPHTVVGLGMLLLLFSKIILALIGSHTEARVLEKTTQHGAKSSVTYKVAYSFTHGVADYSGSTQIDQKAYQRLRDGGPVPIVYLSFAPQYVSDYQDPHQRFPANTGFLLFIALFWNGIVAIFVYVLYIDPWRRKQLIIHGMEVPGQIQAKRLQRGAKGGTRHVVDYTYTVQGQLRHASITTTRAQHEACQEGDTLAIAYDPLKPQRSVPVDLSPWELVRH